MYDIELKKIFQFETCTFFLQNRHEFRHPQQCLSITVSVPGNLGSLSHYLWSVSRFGQTFFSVKLLFRSNILSDRTPKLYTWRISFVVCLEFRASFFGVSFAAQFHFEWQDNKTVHLKDRSLWVYLIICDLFRVSGKLFFRSNILSDRTPKLYT